MPEAVKPYKPRQAMNQITHIDKPTLADPENEKKHNTSKASVLKDLQQTLFWTFKKAK